MSTTVVERELSCSIGDAWQLLADVGNLQRAFPGIVQDTQLNADGVRTVTFAGGPVIREQIVTVDQARRRVAYSILGGRFTSHAASMQIVQGECGARLVWITDCLPESATGVVQGLMERGSDAFALSASVG